MSSEADAIAEERRKAKEMKAFADAREQIQSKAKDFVADAEAQLSELKRRTVDEFEKL